MLGGTNTYNQQVKPTGQTANANSGGYNYKMDGHHARVGVREVAPRGSVNPSRNALTPHPEAGKRRAGWRLEWILFLLAFACVGTLLLLYAAG